MKIYKISDLDYLKNVWCSCLNQFVTCKGNLSPKLFLKMFLQVAILAESSHKIDTYRNILVWKSTLWWKNCNGLNFLRKYYSISEFTRETICKIITGGGKCYKFKALIVFVFANTVFANTFRSLYVALNLYFVFANIFRFVFANTMAIVCARIMYSRIAGFIMTENRSNLTCFRFYLGNTVKKLWLALVSTSFQNAIHLFQINLLRTWRMMINSARSYFRLGCPYRLIALSQSHHNQPFRLQNQPFPNRTLNQQ